ncbi:hypothetical protein NXS98_03650 [Fontisphaera persica]|uniref:hypothetical protein n=1 Tax=Fontisphaera persica TaxID=2974023 RepID=UPI0024C07514|nr:hypothetical protein [Fontisphaera persica]WCJ60236.1 hypothetical protein NXS98_03650 [Fontisphaera persica]
MNWMQAHDDAALDQLWQEYALVFREFDDLTLARWLAQTLGQLTGKIWRASHPLVSAYRVASMVAHERQIWLKRLTNRPAPYNEATCCRAPLVPMFTRDVKETGLLCLHCGETAVTLEELPAELTQSILLWCQTYAPVHQVAHWEQAQQQRVANYEDELDRAFEAARDLLLQLHREVLPQLLALYPAVVWEDHDECLDVRPEDLMLR